MLFPSVVLSLLLAAANAAPLEIYSNDITLEDSDFNWSKPTLDDASIISSALDVLNSISNSTLDSCGQCKSRLLYGKALALSRPDLIPTIFEEWCNADGNYTSTWCATNYHRNTVANSDTGSNFADVLSLIDPMSLDAEFWCYYKSLSACPIPELPENFSVAHLWNNTKPAKALTAPVPGNETFNVLHISDFHIEWEYTVGAEANCTASMCCTPHSVTKNGSLALVDQSTLADQYGALFAGSYYDDNGKYITGDLISFPTNITMPATSFGNYECDAPEILINSSLYSVADFQKNNNMSFEFALFTGDAVDHDEVKYTSYEKTVESEEVVFRDMKAILRDVPIYPVLGNHDTFPYGQLAPEKSGFKNKFDWNAELMTELWKDYNWIDFQEAQISKTHYTGYSVNTKRGLKIISFNSNAWYTTNEYAFIGCVTDPDVFGVFDFLVSELLDAESNDQRVWINFHIPASSAMVPTQAKLFTEVLERFSPYTIAGIFNGHTHRDEFNVLYGDNDGTNSTKIESNVVNMAWICQAVTPWVENNPAWRYYEIDTKTFSVMNAFNYYTQLNATFNSDAEPVWEYEYSSRDAYGVEWPETSPLNGTYWHRVAEKMHQNESTLQDYENFAKRFSPFTPACAESDDCDADWCYVTSFTASQYAACLKEQGISST